ncbi:MAG: maleylpyruvate isomerase family mycothiol-dependent enzyme [Microthrixaceae bacterium]
MEILGDLIDEQSALAVIVDRIDDADWLLPTPSPGWTIAHQIAHLTYFDRAAAQAIADPWVLRGQGRPVPAGPRGWKSLDDLTITDLVELPPEELRSQWAEGRELLATAAAPLSDTDRIEWFGPSMSARSFLTARLMEAWAHGQDIIDALTTPTCPTRPVRRPIACDTSKPTWASSPGSGPTWCAMPAPATEVAVELVGPTGETWRWGPTDATSRITGPAGDFCAVVTQRRHVTDTDLVLTGDEAAD